MVLAELLEELAAVKGGAPAFGGAKAIGAATSPLGPYLTGPGGLFGVAGLQNEIISTRMIPSGLAAALPARGSMDMYPLYPYITGFLDTSGANAAGVCDSGPMAGTAKGCLQTAPFGRYSFITRPTEIDRVGQRLNRGEFQDLRIQNSPFDQNQGNGIVSPSTGNGNPNIYDEVSWRMAELRVAFQNKLSKQLYEGNAANNNAGGGYKEFFGLDTLIGTGKKDAITGTSCPSLDSDLKDFNYLLIDTNGNAAVNALTYLMRTLRTTAEGTGFGEVTWALVMRETLFYELTAVWPCSYLTYRCAFTATDGSQVLNMDAGDQITMRDSMRNGQYLMIDGRQVRVILDAAIPEDTSTTTNRVGPAAFASDIYVVPLTGGGQALTFWEYLDYNNTPGAMQAAMAGHVAPGFFWSDGGKYLWHALAPNGWCIQAEAKIEPRLILRTPHLAGKLSNVAYKPLQHPRDAYSSDPYFVDGGISTGRAVPSYYNP